MSSDLAIEVQNLSKCFQIYDRPQDRLFQMVLGRRKQLYREFWAIEDVSFEVRKGESVGIIGRNGSGKSTLLQLICGTLHPTAGAVRTSGRIAALLELGSGFNGDFSGRENVYLNGAMHGLSREDVDERFDAIARFADIGEFIEQPVKTYSSGMFVRLAFAVQANLDPEILVVDEALAVGDALFQKRCYERIEALISSGTTLLFVSHDEESVRTLTQHALLLRDGKVVARGQSSEVLLEYRRQLHDQERRYLTHMARDLNSVKQPSAGTDSNQAKASDRYSFGDLEAEIVQVTVCSGSGEGREVFYPTDPVRIVVRCIAHKALQRLNVGLRLRNKEGVKMYSWGTLNQDMQRAAAGEVDLYWHRAFNAGEEFSVAFEFACVLGPNLYEVQASIAQEGKPYYAEQRMLHWRDEAAFFTVVTKPREYHFGGAVDLRMTATPV